MRRTLWTLFCGLSIFVLSCSSAWAQATAQISGVVKDQSGAVLPGVEVVATQIDTGISRTALTNETGSYILPNLPIGPYRLEAGLPGFRTYAQTGIVLQVNGSPVINPVLEVGQVTEQVEVQANAALVETRTVGVGSVVENARILELPLNGRNVTELIALSGAAAPSTTGTNNRDPFVKTTISVAGGSAMGLNYTLDGANHNNPVFGTYMAVPFPDALQEFKVETSGMSAEKGVKPAGSVSLVTKSGTNEFHGDLFEFVRNGKFNARDPFALTRDTIKRNQFGGTFGGPIRRNKLFFFGGYQGTILRQDPATSIVFVPTPAMLAGDFSVVASSACRTSPITLRSPFVNNRIDPAMFSKAAVNLTKRLPSTLDPCGENRGGAIEHTDEHMAIGKIDYQKSAPHSLFGRYLVASSVTPAPYEIRQDALRIGNGTDALTQAFTLGSTYLVTANIVNSLRLSATRLAGGRIAASYFSFPDLGVKMFTYTPDKLRLTVTDGFSVSSSASGPTRDALFALNDDISVIRGVHQMAFGANGASWWVNHCADMYATGNAAFTADTTGMGLADFLMGSMNQWTMGTPECVHKRDKYIGLYGSDTWKLTRTLTVNYGLRWEPFFPVVNLDDTTHHFDMDALRKGIKSTRFTTTPPGVFYEGDSQVRGKSDMYDQWWNVSPRVGFAWDISGDGRTSLRASAGTFYDYPFTHYQTSFRGPPQTQRVVINNVPFDDPWAGYPGGDPFPVKESGGRLTADASFPLNSIILAVDSNTHNTRVGQWNVSLQRQIGDVLLSASYIGSATRHLWSTQHINPGVFVPGVGDAGGRCFLNGQAVPYTVRAGAACSTTGNIIQRRRLSLEIPTIGQYYGYVNKIDPGGTASYNGLLLSVQRRAARGVTLSANYTWSHCITDPGGDEAANTGSANGGYTNPDNRSYDRGNCAGSSLDRRHIFNLSGVAQTPEFSNRALRIMASGWRISPILRFQAGSWLSVSAGSDLALNGIAGQRANQILPNVYGSKTASNWLNPQAFSRPVSGTLGNMSPGTILGPSNTQFDVALSREFQTREEQRVEFRAEAFNVTNSVQLGNPNTSITSSQFGQIRSGRGARIMQFALKYFF